MNTEKRIILEDSIFGNSMNVENRYALVRSVALTKLVPLEDLIPELVEAEKWYLEYGEVMRKEGLRYLVYPYEITTRIIPVPLDELFEGSVQTQAIIEIVNFNKEADMELFVKMGDAQSKYYAYLYRNKKKN